MTLPDRLPHLAPQRVIDTSSGRVQVREVRAPQAATQSLRWTSPGMPMVADWDAETAVRWGFYANVIVYRCVQIVANTIASRPFRAGLRPPKNPTDPGDFDENARLAQLLGPPPGGPVPGRLSARRLWAWTLAQRIVTGKHAWEVETASRAADAEVVALWPLVSSQTRPIPSEGGVDWFSAFDYGPQHKARRLRNDQIVYGWNPSLNDFRQPESALQSARLDISIAVMMDRYNVAFLRNDARPAAVVVTESFADRQEYEAFKAQFRGEYGGPDNAGKTAFVEAEGGGDGVAGSIDIKVLGLSQKDARFIEQHQASLNRVAMALGVPWSKLDASGRTFDNASEEDHAWWESELLPKMMDLQDEVNMQLAPRLGREVGWFDLSDVRALQAPKNVQAVGAPSLVSGGISTVNESRAMVGLPPVDGGDVLVDVVGIAMAALATAATPAGDEEPTVEPPPAPIAVEPPEPVEPAELTAAPPAGETRAEDRIPTPEEVEARRARIWRTTDAVVRTLESRWERRWQAFFARQAKATVARLEGNRGRKVVVAKTAGAEVRDPAGQVDPAAVFSREFWTAESADLAEDLYETVMAAGGARVSDLFGIAFDLSAPYVQDFIQARANQLAGQVTDTTYESIQQALVEGVAEGESIPDLAKRIRHVFDVASSSRATTIARTETISAFNASSHLVVSQLPADVVAGKEYIATRDGRTREAHAEADGQVVAVDAPFYVGGEALLYPGDPSGSPENVIQCRCTVAYLTPEEMTDRAAVDREVRAPLRPLLAMLTLLPRGDDFDLLAARRAFQEVAA